MLHSAVLWSPLASIERKKISRKVFSVNSLRFTHFIFSSCVYFKQTSFSYHTATTRSGLNLQIIQNLYKLSYLVHRPHLFHVTAGRQDIFFYQWIVSERIGSLVYNFLHHRSKKRERHIIDYQNKDT